MSEFTQVNLLRGTEGLARSQGFWSGKEILINNNESTIYVLDEKTTTQDLLDTIREVIEANLRNWVLWDMQRNTERLQNGKNTITYFSLQSIPSLNRSEWLGGMGVSLLRMMKIWQGDGKTTDQLCEFLANEWVSAW